jgi:hypothetical protein
MQTAQLSTDTKSKYRCTILSTNTKSTIRLSTDTQSEYRLNCTSKLIGSRVQYKIRLVLECSHNRIGYEYKPWSYGLRTGRPGLLWPCCWGSSGVPGVEAGGAASGAASGCSAGTSGSWGAGGDLPETWRKTYLMKPIILIFIVGHRKINLNIMDGHQKIEHYLHIRWK